MKLVLNGSMLSAPNNTFTKYDLSHLNQSNFRKTESLTSRLSTWKQIKPFIYKSMINSDKSNAHWLQNELSSFEQIIRKEYPKDVVPIIMDDHIRSVLTKYPQQLHKSILKLLFAKIPKLKPATLFIIPSTPTDLQLQTTETLDNDNDDDDDDDDDEDKTPSLTPNNHPGNSPSLSPINGPIMKTNSSDSLIHSSSDTDDDNNNGKSNKKKKNNKHKKNKSSKVASLKRKNNSNSNNNNSKLPKTKSTKLISHNQSDSLIAIASFDNHASNGSIISNVSSRGRHTSHASHTSASSISDSNLLFSPEFKFQKHIALNLTDDIDHTINLNGNNNDNDNVNNQFNRKLNVSPSGSSMIDGFDYHQEIQSDDNEDDIDDIVITVDHAENDTDENETDYRHHTNNYDVDQRNGNKHTDSSEYNEKIVGDSTDDDDGNGHGHGHGHSHNNNDKGKTTKTKRSSSKSSNFGNMFNILKNRTSTDDGNRQKSQSRRATDSKYEKKLKPTDSLSTQRKILNSVDTTHLANRISDIQNRNGRYSVRNGSITASNTNGSDGGSSPPSSRISTINEIDIDSEMHDLHQQISASKENQPYSSSILYILIYILNMIHTFTTIWLLVNTILFTLKRGTNIPIFILILLYFNVSTFCLLELWKGINI